MSKDPRRSLTEAQAAEVLAVRPSQYDADLLRLWLAFGGKGKKPLFDRLASLPIPARLRSAPIGEPSGPGDWDVRYAPNWSEITQTTVGRLVANNYIFRGSRALREGVPFVNAPWDGKTVGKLEARIGELRLQGKITHDDVAGAIDRLQWMGYFLTAMIAPSMTSKTISIPAATAKLKAELLVSRHNDLTSGGLSGARAAMEVEQQLLASARAELDGADPGMDVYNSGARGSFNNNYKNVALMRGAIRRSDDPSVIRVSTASLEEGIPSKEMDMYADLITQASYNRSISVRDGGYLAKQLNAAFQGLRLNPDPESDCKTPLRLEVTIDDPAEYVYRFAVGPRGALTEITPDNMGEFRGRPTALRSPMFCGDTAGICSRCAGTFYHKLGVVNIGLLTSRIGTTIMNNNLKAFHDTTIRTVEVDLGKYIRKSKE